MSLGFNERKEWIKTLNVGSELIVEEHNMGYVSYEKAKVVKITPTGLIGVNTIKSSKFRDGTLRCGEFNYYYLEPINDKAIYWIEKRKALSEIASIKMNTLTLTKLNQIREIMKDEIKKAQGE
jgi:hypothetical protein